MLYGPAVVTSGAGRESVLDLDSTTTDLGRMRGVLPIIIRRSNQNRQTFSVCSHLLQRHVMFLNAPIAKRITSSVITRLLCLSTRSPRGSMRLCVGSPKKSIATKVTVCSAVRRVQPSIIAVYFNLTTDVKTFLLYTNTGNGQLSLPDSQVVVRRPLNNTRKRTISVTVRTGRVLCRGGHLGRLVTCRARRPVRQIRTSARHSFCVSTTSTGRCKLVSSIVSRRSLSIGPTMATLG